MRELRSEPLEDDPYEEAATVYYAWSSRHVEEYMQTLRYAAMPSFPHHIHTHHVDDPCVEAVWETDDDGGVELVALGCRRVIEVKAAEPETEADVDADDSSHGHEVEQP